MANVDPSSVPVADPEEFTKPVDDIEGVAVFTAVGIAINLAYDVSFSIVEGKARIPIELFRAASLGLAYVGIVESEDPEIDGHKVGEGLSTLTGSTVASLMGATATVSFAYGAAAFAAFEVATFLVDLFGNGDGIFDPVGAKIADLQEQFPDVPLEAVAAVTMTAIEEHTSKYNPWGQPSQEVQADWIFDPGFSESNDALQEILENMQAYYSYFGTDLPYPEDTGTETSPAGGPVPDNGPDRGRDDDDDTAAVVVAPVAPDPTAPTPGTSWVDPNTGRTNVQGDPVTGAGGHGTQAPVILDLDGDGVEVAFGEDIYFDLDDDGFLVIDLNADGTRGAGDGVIDQSNELVLSSLGQEGDTDLQALARYDGNGDGKLDAQDAIWTELKVWQDLNQDGKTEGDGTELKTLAAWGISSINIAYDDGTDFTGETNDIEVFGNILHGLEVAA